MARKEDESQTDGSFQVQEAAAQQEDVIVSELDRRLGDFSQFLSRLSVVGKLVKNRRGQLPSQVVKNYIVGLSASVAELSQELHPAEGGQKRFEVAVDNNHNPIITFSHGLLPDPSDTTKLTGGTMRVSYSLVGEGFNVLTLGFKQTGETQGVSTAILYRTCPSDNGGVAESLVVNDPRAGIGISQTWTVKTSISPIDANL